MCKNAVGILVKLLILSLITSCSPVKRVLRSPEKTMQVVQHWVKSNPQSSDTLISTGVTNETIDTIWLSSPSLIQLPSESVTVPNGPLTQPVVLRDTVYSRILVTRNRVDTVQVRNYEFLKIWQKSVEDMKLEDYRKQGQIKALQEVNAQVRKDKWRWQCSAIGTWLFIVVIVGLYIYFKIKSAPLKAVTNG